MTSDLLTTLAILLILLIGLDIFILRFRRDADLKKLPLVEDLLGIFIHLTDWFERAQAFFANPQQLLQRAAAFVTAKRKVPAPRTEPAISQLETESVTSETFSLEDEIPVADEELPTPNGKVARVHLTADLPPGTILHITISADKEGHASVEQSRQPAPKYRAPRAIRLPDLPSLPDPRPAIQHFFELPSTRLSTGLFLAALAIYLLTRLIGLTDFPIYFFGDEAIQTATASDLVLRGLRGPDGTFLPTYFQNGLYFNLSTSVYLQILPQLLFGKSIFVTRATSVLVTMLAALCTGLMLRDFFGAKRWWLAPILLSVVPAWFLHSRTAFETALFVSFYATFLYFYLDYRLRNPKRVYWAVVFAGLAFYSYSPGQLVLAVTGVFLFFSDLKYHWQQRNTLIIAIGLLALVALPYLRFRLAADYSPLDHLRSLGSYLIQPIPVTEKMSIFFGEYAHGLSPLYWFFDAPDMARHQMRGYGNIPLWFAPFLFTGIIAAVVRFRSPAQRLVLLSALAAPSGAALAEIGITRILVFVIPASMLAALGLDLILTWLENFVGRLNRELASSPVFGNLMAVFVFAVIAIFNVYMLGDALVNGPTWYTDYGLYGMQFGAKQVYQDTVVPVLEKDPEAYFVVTPSWANGAEHFVGFFVPPRLHPRIMLGQIYDLLKQKPKLKDKTYFLVTDQEYENIIQDPKFKKVIVRSTIPYPDGRNGYYILNIELSDNIDEILAQEEVERLTPVEETVQWLGQTVRVLHSPLGGGIFADLIDDNPDSLAKGEQANPITFEFFFTRPVSATELVLTTGSMSNFDVAIQIYPAGSSEPIIYARNFKDLPDDPTINIPLSDGPAEFDHVSISIRDNNQGEFAQVHVREITFK